MTQKTDPTPRFFKTPAAFRVWLEKHHDTETELWIGFYKKGSGKQTIVYPEALDEALCFGWIDTTVRARDATSYMQRFTPRNARSIWSNVNVAKVKALIDADRMTPAGLAAYERRDPARTGIYSFERDTMTFDAAAEQAFKKNRAAWEFFQAQPPGYRKLATHYACSAKKEETRERRLKLLIDVSARGERLPGFQPAPKKR